MAKYWYCVKHSRVEQGEDICPPIDRLGPYDSREAAEHALEQAEQRNQEWDEDPSWKDVEGGPGTGGVSWTGQG